MVGKTIIFFVIFEVIYGFPQSIKLPEIKNLSPPEEINSLIHNHQPRSISTQKVSYNTVEDTIKEVEAMIRANPTLPRLTRGEILDLLENITKGDLEKQNIKNKGVEDRDPKAIMVVMPYTPTNSDSSNMEELFTKPPVTHIIGAEPFKKKEESVVLKKQYPQYSDTQKLVTEKQKSSRGTVQFTQIQSSTASPKISVKEQKVTENNIIEKNPHHRRRKPQVSKQPSIENHSESQGHQLPLTSPTKSRPKGSRPIRRRPTTTEKHPNHKYPDEISTESPKIETLPSNGIRIVEPPKLFAENSAEDLYMQENQQHGVFLKKHEVNNAGNLNVVSNEEQLNIELTTKNTLVKPQIELEIPAHLKGVVDSMDLQSAIKKEPIKKTTTKAPPVEDEEERIKNLLASFGVLPVKTTSTTTPLPDISNVADNLTPEMRDLLMSFGLIDKPKEKIVSATQSTVDSFNPVKAEIKPESYVGFKPLPNDYESRHEMDELLARFGLGRESRNEKSSPKKREQPKGITFDMVPEEYKGVLEDIGLSDREGRMIRAEPLVKTAEKQHVFSPHETSNEELEKIGKLLTVFKQLEKLNRTVTDEDLKNVDVSSLKELVTSLNEENKMQTLNEQNAPNPVHYEYGLNKNDFKRQENGTSTTTEASTTTVQSSSTTTEENTSQNNLKALEESFGGKSEAPTTESEPPETTTQARRTGFYYLVDWNTFLDIDDQKGKRVNLRFQPTVGDPKRFYSVSVP